MHVAIDIKHLEISQSPESSFHRSISNGFMLRRPGLRPTVAAVAEDAAKIAAVALTRAARAAAGDSICIAAATGSRQCGRLAVAPGAMS